MKELLLLWENRWSHFVALACMGEVRRIGASSDFMCQCDVMGGEMLVRGKEFIFPSGHVGHELVKASTT